MKQKKTSTASAISGLKTELEGLNMYTNGKSMVSRYSLRLGHLIDDKGIQKGAISKLSWLSGFKK
jgi:hypothetical protein